MSGLSAAKMVFNWPAVVSVAASTARSCGANWAAVVPEALVSAPPVFMSKAFGAGISTPKKKPLKSGFFAGARPLQIFYVKFRSSSRY
jgi:hypothetical protein